MPGNIVRSPPVTREERNERASKIGPKHDTKPHPKRDDMAHVVTLRTDPANPAVIYLATPQDMAPVMGGFGPARYVGNNPPIPGVSYVIPAEDLPRFRVYCTNRSVALLDQPLPATPLGRGTPLPECSHCGQPSRRGAQLTHCPNCGEPWAPIQVGHHYSTTAPQHVCESCHRNTPLGFTHCTNCGAPHANH